MKRFASALAVPPSAAPSAVFLAAVFLVPVGLLILSSFWSSGFFSIVYEFTVNNYTRVVEDGVYLNLLRRSIVIGLIVACIAVSAGFLIAYAVRFVFQRTANLVLALVMISLLTSYLVRIYAWKSILGPEGMINEVLTSAGIISEPLGFLLYGDFALVVTLTHILLPLAVLPIYSALQGVDRDTLSASRDLGASGWRTFWHVTFPQARIGVAAAFIFCFILAASDYVTPELVGGTSGMLIGRAVATQFQTVGDIPFGATLAILTIAGLAITIALAALVVTRGPRLTRPLLARLRRHQQTGDGSAARFKPRRVRASRLRGRGYVVRGLTLLALVFLYLPVATVVLFSFNDAPIAVFPLKGLTLDWYDQALSSPPFTRALESSALVSVSAAAAALVIGTGAAFALVRRRFPLRAALQYGSVAPMLVPGVMIGVALQTTLFLSGLAQGLIAAAAAQCLFTIPFVVLTIRARLEGFDTDLELASRDLGASRARTLRRITLPLILPSLLGAAALALALALDEFIITNLVIGSDTTLPILIWSQMRQGIDPTTNAIATLILGASLLLILVGGLGLRRRSTGITAAAER